MTTDLAEHLLDNGPDIDTSDNDARERWQITSDDQAGWALRKMARAQAERARIKDQATAELDRIEQWAKEADAAAAHDEQFFAGKLVEYRRRLEDADPKLPATYKLPWGTLARRKGRESVIVEDADALTSWALDNAPELLRYSPDKKALGDLPRTPDGAPVSSDGEPVPGVTVQRADDRYEVKATVANEVR